MSIDLEKVSGFMRDVAAEKITPRFRQLKDEEIQTKSGPTDLVTIADLEAEIELTRILTEYLPGSLVVGEEAVSKGDIDPKILVNEDAPIWVIDPVDGTNNFASGNEKFGMIVALAHRQETVAAWIYDIPAGRFAMAEKGSGVKINGDDINYSDPKLALNEMRGFVSRKFMPPKIREQVQEVLDKQFGDVETYLCCAHEYLDILSGKAHFSIYSRIRPWDHLAGAMMLQEAGGVIKKWDYSPYGPIEDRGGIVSAPTEGLWDEVHSKLLKPFI